MEALSNGHIPESQSQSQSQQEQEQKHECDNCDNESKHGDIDDRIDVENSNSHSHNCRIERELLEVGMLQHHEIENYTMDEDKVEATCQALSWSNCDATTFHVRCGPNYIPGQKSPSKKALYRVFAMDAYKLSHKMNKIFEFINIAKYVDKYKGKSEGDNDILPPLFILNGMVPNYTPEIMGGKSDGEGFQLIIYAHLTQEIQTEINSQSQSLRPSVQLLRDFIHSDLVSSEIRNRFKVIARVMNPSYTDFGFFANRLVKRYNGKPFLARTSSTFYYEKGQYFAADIDVHLFGYPARQGLSYVKDTIQTAIYDIGFVIEGHSNDQLPEQILACCRVSKCGVDLCKPFPYPHRSSQACSQSQSQPPSPHRTHASLNNGTLNQNKDKNEEENDKNKDKNGNENENNSSWGWGYFG